MTGTSGQAGNQIIGRRRDQLVDQPLKPVRVAECPQLGRGEVAAGAALDHVGRHRPGRTGEADQRGATRQRIGDPRHGLEDRRRAVTDTIA